MRHDPTADAAAPSAAPRAAYARAVARHAGIRDPRVEQAFAAVPREPFAGPPPWLVLSPGEDAGWRSTTDPAALYQDVLVALDPARGINMGEPGLHARCLDALALRPGEAVLQVGAGSGYYTALLAELVGPQGRVTAYEVEPDLAARARRNLADRPWVTVEPRSGVAEGLPAADAIYANAAIDHPAPAWLAALRPGGRLLFPLQPGAGGGFGGMLLAERPAGDGPAWPARFVGRARFISCQAPAMAADPGDLARAFAGGAWAQVRSLRLGGQPDEGCWYDGGGWWLSTEAVPAGPA